MLVFVCFCSGVCACVCVLMHVCLCAWSFVCLCDRACVLVYLCVVSVVLRENSYDLVAVEFVFCVVVVGMCKNINDI